VKRLLLNFVARLRLDAALRKRRHDRVVLNDRAKRGRATRIHNQFARDPIIREAGPWQGQ